MKISIIMPTYNDSSTIIDTIDSVANQSYSNWQLIIMNDGSTDNVEDVIKQYRDNSVHKEKIEYYSQKNQDQLNAIRNCIRENLFIYFTLMIYYQMIICLCD